MQRVLWGLVSALMLVIPAMAQAQTVIVDIGVRRIAPIPPIPTPRPTPIPSAYRIKLIDVQASVKDQVATVQISQIFQNVGSTTLEAQLFFPMPDDAAISGLTLMVDGREMAGKLLKKEDARRIYEEIVRRRQDPALLEYMGQGLFQTSVFPVPAGAERKVDIRYQQLLKKDNGLIDLVLPIGTNKHSNHPIDALNATIRIEAADQIKTIYSPSHQVSIERPDNTHAVCKLALTNVYNPDDFRLLYGTTAGLVGMNVLSYKPLENEDGYFVLLASPAVQNDGKKVDKSVVFTVDKSGSMSGKKMDQAKEALKFLINQLKPGDTFNIVAYDSAVETFRPELQKVDDATIKAALGYADGLYAGGSTNIDGALQTSLKMLTDNKRPSYVLFMTDGLPTVGELNEQKISTNAKSANVVNARLFTFGVGFDVNSRLLDRLSHDQRGTSIYVQPNENIEAQVATLYNKIASPLLTDLVVNFEFDTAPAAGSAPPISRTYPRQLTDLFQGEQLVWVGRYRQGGTVKVTLSGSVNQEKKTFMFPATLETKSMDSNGFVEKLWATRRIGEIIDELDLKGQNQELINELVQLSLKHGIITPYTSFLADENVSLADRSGQNRQAGERAGRELSKAEGRDGFAQRSAKNAYQNAANPAAATPSAGASSAPGGPGARAGGMRLAEKRKDARNALVMDPDGNVRELETVRNVGQKTFYKKQNQWQDSTVTADQMKNPQRVRQFSQEYFDLAAAHGGQLAKYLAFEEPVILNLGDKTYQIDPPDPKDVKTDG